MWYGVYVIPPPCICLINTILRVLTGESRPQANHTDSAAAIRHPGQPGRQRRRRQQDLAESRGGRGEGTGGPESHCGQRAAAVL
jgi:hypothetical protein